MNVNMSVTAKISRASSGGDWTRFCRGGTETQHHTPKLVPTFSTSVTHVDLPYLDTGHSLGRGHSTVVSEGKARESARFATRSRSSSFGARAGLDARAPCQSHDSAFVLLDPKLLVRRDRQPSTFPL